MTNLRTVKLGIKEIMNKANIRHKAMTMFDTTKEKYHYHGQVFDTLKEVRQVSERDGVTELIIVHCWMPKTEEQRGK